MDNNGDTQNIETEVEIPFLVETDIDEYISHISEREQIKKDEMPLDLLEKKEPSALDWKIKTGLDEESVIGVVESLIFMSEKPISLLKIKSLIDEEIPLEIVHEAVLKLQAEYDLPRHGIRPTEVASGYQFRTKTSHNKYIQKMFKATSLILTPQALEVLAIVAYRGPLSRMEIDKIRGVDSSHLLRTLIDKKIVKVARKAEEATRGVLYEVSEDFLELFGLNSIEDLPPEHELENLGKTEEMGKISDIRQFVKGGTVRTEDLKKEFDELDNLGLMIKDISADTLFTKSIRKEENKRFNKVEEIKVPDVSETIVTENEENTQENSEITQPINLQPQIEMPKPKSAFELMEEFILKEEIAEENKKACESIHSQDEIKNILFDLAPAVEIESNASEDVIEEHEILEEYSETNEDIIDMVLDDDLEVTLEDIEEDESTVENGEEENLEPQNEDQNKEDRWFSDDLVDDEEPEEGNEIDTDEIIKEAEELDLDLSFLNDPVTSEKKGIE